MRFVGLATMGCALFILAACSDEPDPMAPVEEAVRLTDVSAPLLRQADRRVPDSYIIVLNDEAVDPASVAAAHGAHPRFVYTAALRGFSAELSTSQLARLRRDARVKYIEEDAMAFLDQQAPPVPPSTDPGASFNLVQSPATWGIDRIDQWALPLSNSYGHTLKGRGVNVYIIDTGIRPTHTEFDGTLLNRAKVGATGFDGIGDGQNGKDCNGHGTHVAGTVAGQTYGIAKEALVYSVRVFGCSGPSPWSTIIAGVDWVTNNHRKPAVANMSLGGGFTQAVNDAVTKMISYGVVTTISAGNEDTDACLNSPASTPTALTVSATNLTSSTTESRALVANTGFWSAAWGTCVDIFAPGHGITSAWKDFDTQIATISGTSMAAPHVAGMAALYLSRNKTAGTGTTTDVIKSMASVGSVQNAGTGTPNLLLHKWNGILGGTGAVEPVNGFAWWGNVGYHHIWLQGSPSTNFNIRLYRWNGSNWVDVARRSTASTAEFVLYHNQIANWMYYEVSSAAGGGTYDLFTIRP